MGGSPLEQRGYSLYVVVVVLAVAAIIAAAALELAATERMQATQVDHDAHALALAELGLERTVAWLGQILETQPDLDRALDPLGDDACTFGPPFSASNDSDDHLPPFSDGAPVTAGSWLGTSAPGPGRYLRVPWPSGAAPLGAFFVRVDDNQDDGLPGLAGSTNNGAGAGCYEGPGFDDPVRDRDQTVVVTAIGVSPGTDLDGAKARRAIRALVGPPDPYGIVAGGAISMGGSAHVCGAFGDEVAQGAINGGCLCSSACQCGAGSVCTAKTASATCTATNRTPASVCRVGTRVQRAPPVSPWDARHAPPACRGPTCAVPFFFLRFNEEAAQAELWQWKFVSPGCQDPRAWPRICRPLEVLPGPAPGCGSCWVRQIVGPPGHSSEIRTLEAPSWDSFSPPPGVPPRSCRTPWRRLST